MKRISGILNFWFEGLNDQTRIEKNSPAVRKWFVKDPDMDSAIRQNFEPDLLKAARGEYSEWEKLPEGRLALVILYDQFPRNMYRDTPGMFAFDHKALELALRSIEDAVDKSLSLIQRLFLYMPLMHSEDKQVQKLSLQYFGMLVNESREKTPENTSYFENSLGFAKRHCEIIEMFGRFPHRNQILNRPSFPKELEFLTQPNSRF